MDMEKIMQSRMDRGFQKYQKEYEDKALEVLLISGQNMPPALPAAWMRCGLLSAYWESERETR